MTRTRSHVRAAARRLGRFAASGGRTRQVLLAATVIGMLAASVALGAQAATTAFDGGQRKPQQQHVGPVHVAADGGNQTVTVPFAADVSRCAATASPTAALQIDTLAVAIGSDGKSVVVTEPNARSAVGLHLQVTC